ncbi:MAG: chromosomal replication initiator protein DnaA [Clostridiales bacterium]|nr:chromosomal replication initiator protein DnaA [Clostridiales bacterium]
MQSLDDVKNVWSLVKDKMKEDFSQTTLDLWFGNLDLISLTESRAVFMINSDFKRNIIINKYHDIISTHMADILGFEVEIIILSNEKGLVDIEGIEQISASVPQPQSITSVSPSFSGEKDNLSMDSSAYHNDSVKYVSKEYTFDNFIVGNSNKFAHAACIAVANNPSTAYNPLFIYGQSGLGKTHLMYAITNQISINFPNSNIIYIKGEEFTNQLIDSISKQHTIKFRDKYRNADVLLIDDIQFIAGKESTQEEFFHTFNSLYEEHKQIILTSDRPPRDIKTLEDRLKTRFEWGLIVDIQPPDIELRMAIIKKKAAAMDLRLPNDVVTYLADRLKSNIRQLEGAIKKIAAMSFLTGSEVTLELAKNAISDLLSGSEPVNVTIDKIFNTVSKRYNIPTEVIKSKKRTDNIANARHICIYLLRSLTELSLSSIGSIFSRDHTTILSSVRKIEKDIEQNPLFETEISDLIKEVKG